jgi:UDP-glucuronate 4-epimerase
MLKRARLQELGITSEDAESGSERHSRTLPNFSFQKLALENRRGMEALFSAQSLQHVCHLAAQAGVRYSLVNPRAYLESNIVGFLNVLEGCKSAGVRHLVFASSSSVYGLSRKMPFSERSPSDHPVSIYGASKKANEMMAHSYAHLYRLPVTGLRFFTVYGPWGRPDMAYYKFARAITEGTPIELFNAGEMKRDFTYVDDVVEGLLKILDRPAAPDPSWNPEDPDPSASSAPFRIYNMGNSRSEPLSRLIAELERCFGRKAKYKEMPMQPGDVKATEADLTILFRDFGWKPSTVLEDGIEQFVNWYQRYQKENQ